MTHPPHVRLAEFFTSIQGESTFAGLPCTFVRLAGCDLRCGWCDTAWARDGGEAWAVPDLVARVQAADLPLVEVTGGEPLLQEGTLPLLAALVERGATVLLETSGSRSIAEVPEAVHVILDLKAPGSGEVHRNLWANLDILRPHHEVKVVLASREDYLWARDEIRRRGVLDRCPVLFSPVPGHLHPRDLAGWLVADRLPVRLQVQLHKVIWSPDTRGV